MEKESAPSGRRKARAAAVRLTARDRELLAFVAVHRLVLATHVQALLGVSARAANGRLRSLASAGILAGERVFHRRPGCYRITRKGLAVVDSDLPPPRIDLRGYEHDIGVAWLWLAAHNGAFGGVREVLSERQLRSADAGGEGTREPLAVRLGGAGASAGRRLHYPDLLLITPHEKRIALELELSPKGRTRLEKILAGYGADSRIDAVLYLVEDRRLAHSLQASAARLDVSHRIHVQAVRRPDERLSGARRTAAKRTRENACAPKA